MGVTPTVSFTVRYFAAVVTELIASGISPDDIDSTVEMLLVDAHRDHPTVLDEAVGTIRANTAAATRLMRVVGL